jgi:hypothetical protein
MMTCRLVLDLCLALPLAGLAQTQRSGQMAKYVIERELPGAGLLSADQLKGIARKSCNVLNELGPGIQWVQSYVTDDKIYCVYIARDEDIIREHARCMDIPTSRISRVVTMTDPTTGEQAASPAH